jgi:hypothetical protein
MKSRNILIKNDMTCVIADLGMAVRDEHVATDMPPRPCGGTVVQSTYIYI